MYIKDLYIKSFRSIDYLHLVLTKGKNVIVGKNNAGKSNIIKALDISFGDKNPAYVGISYTDFHEHEDVCCDEFWILSRLMEADINEAELSKMRGVYRGKLKAAPFSNDRDKGQITLVKENCIFDADEYFPSFSNKTYFKPNGKDNSTLNVLIESIKKAHCLWVLFYASSSTHEQDGVYTKEYRFFYQEKVEDPAEQKDAPWYVMWGISPAFRDSLITSAILPAFREPMNQLKANAWSWYGKLLKKVWEEKKDSSIEQGVISAELEKALAQVESIGNSIYDALSGDISSKINVAFSDTSINFRYFHNLKDIYKQVQVFVNDGFNSNLQNKGSGIQSAVIIGLFSYYCSVFHHNATILAIEEPELYLHPQARRVISKRLSEFVDISQDRKNQVIVITHSTEFIRAGEINNISVIKKISNQTVSANYKIDNNNTREIQTLLKSENSEMFFADKVIICEGGEKIILSIMADIISGKTDVLDEYNISIVRANGKNDISKFSKILTKCNIEHYAIADLDYLFEGLDISIHNEIGNIRGRISGIKSEWNQKNVKDKMLTPSKSIDAQTFCQKMEDVKEAHERLPELLELWEYIRPKVKEKINIEYLSKEENASLKQHIDSCIDELWGNNKIFILKRGELEDYLTELGREVTGTKETRLIAIKQFVEDGSKIESFFIMDEFVHFLQSVLVPHDIRD